MTLLPSTWYENLGPLTETGSPANGFAKETTLLPSELVKAPGKTGVTCRLNGKWESSKGKFADVVDGRFPSLAKEAPEYAAPTSLAIDAKRLYAVAQGLGSDRVILTFDANENKPVGVVPFDFALQDGFGLIMPAPRDDGLKTTESVAQHLSAQQHNYNLATDAIMPS